MASGMADRACLQRKSVYVGCCAMLVQVHAMDACVYSIGNSDENGAGRDQFTTHGLYIQREGQCQSMLLVDATLPAKQSLTAIATCYAKC